MRFFRLVLLALVLVVAPVHAQAWSCNSGCTELSGSFPQIVYDGCPSQPGTQIGVLEHELVCTYTGNDTCTAVGTVNWTPYVTGSTTMNCSQGLVCNSWDCGGNSFSTQPSGPPITFSTCSTGGTEKHGHSHSLNGCAATAMFTAVIGCGGLLNYATAQANFRCGFASP